MLTRTAFGAPKLRVIKCRQCREPFQKRTMLHTLCSPRCVLLLAEKQEAKRQVADRRLTRQKLEAMKPRAKWLAEAQTATNRYVRLRDAGLPCASCDRPASWDGQWHASHFRSVGAASAVRFHLWNIQKACSICNNWKSGNLSEYEPRLRARIGDERVDWLRTQNQLVTYSVEYLKRLKRVFTKKANRMEKRLEQQQ